MAIELTVVPKGGNGEAAWARELTRALEAFGTPGIRIGSDLSEPGHVVFLDAGLEDLDLVLSRIDRKGRAIFLVVPEDAEAPPQLESGAVDDVIVHPFRSLELLSKLRIYQQILMWDELATLNESFSDLIARLRDDLRLAERLQKQRLPRRFPDIRGFRVRSRYIAGARSGGDYFDLAESPGGGKVALVLTDSSSYGLSSSVLSVLMRVLVKLAPEDSASARETVRRIHEELALTLGEKDRLSLVFGYISRADLSFRYLSLGSASLFHAPKGGSFRELVSQGPAIAGTGTLPQAADASLQLAPGDRVAALSDGFIEAVGGSELALSLLEPLRGKEAEETLNELAFRVKSRLEDPDDLPDQDCTAIVIDVDPRPVRLASG